MKAGLLARFLLQPIAIRPLRIKGQICMRFFGLYIFEK